MQTQICGASRSAWPLGSNLLYMCSHLLCNSPPTPQKVRIWAWWSSKACKTSCKSFRWTLAYICHWIHHHWIRLGNILLFNFIAYHWDSLKRASESIGSVEYLDLPTTHNWVRFQTYDATLIFSKWKVFFRPTRQYFSLSTAALPTIYHITAPDALFSYTRKPLSNSRRLECPVLQNHATQLSQHNRQQKSFLNG